MWEVNLNGKPKATVFRATQNADACGLPLNDDVISLQVPKSFFHSETYRAQRSSAIRVDQDPNTQPIGQPAGESEAELYGRRAECFVGKLR